MSFLSQSHFPMFWNAFQYMVGGTVDKRSLCLKHYQRQNRILEVGCSLGNISRAFVGLPDIEFTGVDIDPVVIDYARKRFRKETAFEFVCIDLEELVESGRLYDYILFAGILHHVDNQKCHSLLNSAAKILDKGTGRLVVVEPLIPSVGDSWFVHKYLMLEKGRYLRTGDKLSQLLQQVPGLEVKEKEEHLINACPFHWPVCARFGVYLLCK